MAELVSVVLDKAKLASSAIMILPIVKAMPAVLTSRKLNHSDSQAPNNLLAVSAISLPWNRAPSSSIVLG